MIGWLIFCVARLTVDSAVGTMIEIGGFPGSCGMTVRALACIVVGWFVNRMAGLTVHTGSRMTEVSRSPAGGIVA